MLIVLSGGVVANVAAGAVPTVAATVGGPNAYGLLMAACDGESLAGTLLASSIDDRPRGWFAATVGSFFLIVVSVGAFTVPFFTMLQSAVDDDLLDRVTSLVTSAASVATPVGSADSGAVAGVLGNRFVVS